MRRLFSPRLMVALVLVAAYIGATVAGRVLASERAANAMATAATRFVASLTPEQKQQAAYAFDSDERLKWHFIPTDMFARNGLTLKLMTEPQRKLALDMLRSGLSQRGYMTASDIMSLETILGALEAAERAAAAQAAAQGGRAGRGQAQPMVRDPERYFFSVFGTPAPKGTWGWRVEGHHISLHFTVVNGSLIASSPTFFGVNPAEVRSGPSTGKRILGAEEDAARALLMSLDEPRRAKAVFNAVAPTDIQTMNQLPINPLNPGGIAASEMTPAQRDLLMKLVALYTSYMTEDVAADRTSALQKAGAEKITFAWAGEAERGKKHYYRVQGPTFLIEYDNTQNDGNHVHSVWRDFNGDFGRDLLREHLASVQH